MYLITIPEILKTLLLILGRRTEKKTDCLLDVDLGYSLLPKSISCILPQSPPYVCISPLSVYIPSPCISIICVYSLTYTSLLRMYNLGVSFVCMPSLSVPYPCVSTASRYGTSLCVYHVSVNIYPLSVWVLSLCVSRLPVCISPLRMGSLFVCTPLRMAPLFVGIPSPCVSRLLPPSPRVSSLRAYCDGMEARTRSGRRYIVNEAICRSNRGEFRMSWGSRYSQKFGRIHRLDRGRSISSWWASVESCSSVK